MARFLKPLVRSGGYYPSRRWTPLVYPGGYTTANGGEEPAPPPIEKTITGNPIHILDALAKPAQALSVKLEPIQDLHGYDNPWPDGGGKQLYDSSTYATITKNGVTCTNNGDGSFTLNGTATADIFFDIFSSQYRESSGGTPLPTGSYRLTGCPSGGTTDTYYMYITPSYMPDTGSGNTNANTTVTGGSIFIKSGYTCNNLVFWPMIRVSTNGDDTFAPYSNICPISGWTGAMVTRTGKNLLPNISGPRSEGSVFIGQANETTYPTHLKAGVTYAISFNTNVGSGFAYMKENGGSNLYFGISGGTYTPEKDMDVQIWVYHSELTSVSDFQLEIGSTATAYEPYQGTTYSIPLGQTVYGGTLDVLTGVLTVDRAYKAFSELVGWQYRVNQFDVSIADGKTQSEAGKPSAFITDTYEAKLSGTSGSYPNDTCAWQGTSSNQVLLLRVRDPSFTSVTDFLAARGNVNICYELATPQTIQLTPQQVELLQGENNIWSDGEMTLVYLADGNASDIEALNILLGGRYVNNHEADEPTDREALDILLGR